jgi:hypothetical protein
MVRPQHALSAGLAIAFSVAMLFTSHLFMESRSAKHLIQGVDDAVLIKVSRQKSVPLI